MAVVKIDALVAYPFCGKCGSKMQVTVDEVVMLISSCQLHCWHCGDRFTEILYNEHKPDYVACEQCGLEFKQNRDHQRFCSMRCVANNSWHPSA